MTRYLTKMLLTSQMYSAVIENPSDRSKALEASYKAAGGKLLGVWFSSDENTLYHMSEWKVDDPATTLALGMAALGAGSISSWQTTRLLTAKEAIVAMKKAKTVGYRPPSKK